MVHLQHKVTNYDYFCFEGQFYDNEWESEIYFGIGVCCQLTSIFRGSTIFEFKFAPVLKEVHLLTLKFIFNWILFINILYDGLGQQLLLPNFETWLFIKFWYSLSWYPSNTAHQFHKLYPCALSFDHISALDTRNLNKKQTN